MISPCHLILYRTYNKADVSNMLAQCGTLSYRLYWTFHQDAGTKIKTPSEPNDLILLSLNKYWQVLYFLSNGLFNWFLLLQACVNQPKGLTSTSSKNTIEHLPAASVMGCQVISLVSLLWKDHVRCDFTDPYNSDLYSLCYIWSCLCRVQRKGRRLNAIRESLGRQQLCSHWHS